MLLNDYMNEHFPQLILRPPLFYNGEIGIRFELGSDNYYEENIYMQEFIKGPSRCLNHFISKMRKFSLS